VQQVIALLPSILAADDEQSKSRLQLFIWYYFLTPNYIFLSLDFLSYGCTGLHKS
jgi:hypothetical protein